MLFIFLGNSLRKVTQHSLKPGRKFSLHSNQKATVPAIVQAAIDLDDLLSVHDMYNMLNDGAMKPFIHDQFNLLILDSRDLKYYSENHVITAKHHASFMANSNLTMRLSNYQMVILYGNILYDDQDTRELLCVQEDLREYTANDILILKDGFDSFLKEYPFLCTDRDIDTIADRKLLLSYPSVIIDKQLYQGRGDQATNGKIISLLHITHIVNISTEHKNAFPNKLKYLKLVLEDVCETNLFEHFRKTSDFINNAISNGGRVFVHCNQGISRSSTITLAYLMRFKKWKLDYAFTTLKARRSCSCPNSGFFKQLSDWEVEMFGERFTNIDEL